MDKINLKTGIYEIRNKVNGKRYIGSATRSFSHRWDSHKYHLRHNKHHSKHLQASWEKYDEENFEFNVLEIVPVQYCIQREQWWLDLYGTYDREYGYNNSPTAGNCRGFKHSEETCIKRKLAAVGRTNSPETRKRISESNKGRIFTKEHLENLTRALRGRKLCKEACIKISERTSKEKHPLWGKKHSKETIERMKKVKEKYTYRVTTPENEEIIITNLREFCRNNNLLQCCMRDVINKKASQHKGYKVEIINTLKSNYE